MTSRSHNRGSLGTDFEMAISTLVTAGYSEPPDLLFDALGHEHRRYALACLDRLQMPMALTDLGAEIALVEHDVDSRAEIPDEAIDSINTMLHHNHVPRLAEARLVSYDSDTHVVELASVVDVNWADLV